VPAEHDVAASKLRRQLTEPRQRSILEVVLDLETLCEQLAVDPRERVVPAVDEEDPDDDGLSGA
jgi:hypothetical protein